MNLDHPTEGALDRYRRRIAAPEELITVDRHIAECDRCCTVVRAGSGAARSTTTIAALLGDPTSGHLTFEELERWVDGNAGIIERQLIDGHVDECELCRNELADLARVRDSMRTAPAAWHAARWLPVAAIVVLALVGGLLYLSQRSHGGQRAAGPAAQRQPLPPAPARIEALARPAIVSSLAGQSSTLLGDAAPGPTFALLAPVGTVVIDGRPRLEWAPLPRAGSYAVTIADAATGAIAASGSTGQTSWQPPAPLAPGRTYSWQVTAHRGEVTVTSPRPPAPEAFFRVARRDEIAAMESWPREDHVRRGVLFANQGFLDDAERELRLAGAGALLAEVRSWRAQRPSPTTTKAAQ